MKILFTFLFLLLYDTSNCQSSEIIKLDEKNAYQYKSYYEDGKIKSIVGFYTKKPFDSVEQFEEKLKAYKIECHGERREFYQNGQLKEVVVYKRNKVIEYAKNYFEDGEEYSVVIESPEFDFESQVQKIWLTKKIQEVESKYNIKLKGSCYIFLDISKDGSIKKIYFRTQDKTNEQYLMEIAKQFKVVKPAEKDGKPMATKIVFQIYN